MLPHNWPSVRIGDVFKKTASEVAVSPDCTYREIGIRSHGKGIFHKEPVLGSQIGAKRVYRVFPGCLTLNIIFAWERALAVTSERDAEFIASHRFPMYEPDSDRISAKFALHYLLSAEGVHALRLASPGGAGRNRTLNQAEFLKLRIPLPPRDEQDSMLEVIDTEDAHIVLYERHLTSLNKLKRGLLQRLASATLSLSGRSSTWATTTIGDHLEEVNRHAPVLDDQEYRLVSVRRKSGGLFERNPLQGKDIGYSKLKQIHEGDFVIARRQVVHGAMARARGKHDNTYVSDAYATLIIKSNSELYMPFFDYLSQTSDLYRKAFRCSYGVALEKLCFNLDWFLREEIRVPSAKDQRRIADVFTVLDKRIRLGQKALAAHKRRRKGLVQQLLGGTIRGGGLSLAKGAVE